MHQSPKGFASAEVLTVAALLALLVSVAYGTGDFVGGLAARRYAPQAVSCVVQTVSLLVCGIAAVAAARTGPNTTELAWGALSGLGMALAGLTLFYGLSVARMSIVVTVSAVLAAVIPAIVGVALGNSLSAGVALGIAIAIPALGLVCWEPGHGDRRSARAGLLYGGLAGVGIALLFVGLDRAGTHAGAWPLIPANAVAVLLMTPFARRGVIVSGKPSRADAALMLGAGLLAGVGNVLFLAATGKGQLAIVAVLSALYPAVTVLLARMFLAERWTRLQAVGLLAAAAGVVLISVG
jgi:uncharacterized membrane protein